MMEAGLVLRPTLYLPPLRLYPGGRPWRNVLSPPSSDSPRPVSSASAGWKRSLSKRRASRFRYYPPSDVAPPLWYPRPHGVIPTIIRTTIQTYKVEWKVRLGPMNYRKMPPRPRRGGHGVLSGVGACCSCRCTTRCSERSGRRVPSMYGWRVLVRLSSGV